MLEKTEAKTRTVKKPGQVAYRVYVSDAENKVLMETADGRQPNDWLSRLIASTGIKDLVTRHIEGR